MKWLAQVFSFGICEIFQNTFFVEQLRWLCLENGFHGVIFSGI